MIPYILSENPEADSRDVFAVTKDMMNGNRFQLFLLELSFIGWYLLGVLLCCVGGVLVVPYQEASIAELYSHLRSFIHGFPFNGYGGEPEVFYDNGNQGDDRYDNQNYGGHNENNGNYYDDRYQTLLTNKPVSVIKFIEEVTTWQRYMHFWQMDRKKWSVWL